MNIAFINKDSLIDEYGDILLNNNDISLSNDHISIAKSNCIHRLMSSFGDMREYPLYGASLEEFIGKKIDDKLLNSMKMRIENALTEDNFLDKTAFSVQMIPDINKVYAKISVGGDESFSNRKDNEINISIDIIEGVVNVL